MPRSSPLRQATDIGCCLQSQPKKHLGLAVSLSGRIVPERELGLLCSARSRVPDARLAEPRTTDRRFGPTDRVSVIGVPTQS